MGQTPSPQQGRTLDREQVLACAGRKRLALSQPTSNGVETRTSTHPKTHQSQGSSQSLRWRSPLLEPTTQDPSHIQRGQGCLAAQTAGKMSLLRSTLSRY